MAEADLGLSILLRLDSFNKHLFSSFILFAIISFPAKRKRKKKLFFLLLLLCRTRDEKLKLSFTDTRESITTYTSMRAIGVDKYSTFLFLAKRSKYTNRPLWKYKTLPALKPTKRLQSISNENRTNPYLQCSRRSFSRCP
jgi:hypothetical protein